MQHRGEQVETAEIARSCYLKTVSGGAYCKDPTARTASRLHVQ